MKVRNPVSRSWQAALVLVIMTLVLPYAVYAEANASKPSVNTVATPPLIAEPAPAVAVEPIDKLDTLFATVLASAARHEFAAAADQIAEVKQYAGELGAQHLERFSLILIELGLDRMQNGKVDEGRFFLTHARELSPNSSRTLFSLAATNGIFTWKESFGLLFRGVLALRQNAFLSIYILAQSAIVCLVGLTVALLMGAIIRLALEGAHIERKIRSYLPYRFRLGSTFVGVALLGLPVLAGVMTALFVWAVCLRRLCADSKHLPWVVGIASAAWLLCLPTSLDILVRLQDPRRAAIEELATGGLPKVRDLQLLQSGIARDAASKFLKALAATHLGKFQEAREGFLSVLAETPRESELGLAALNNIGATYLAQRHYADAIAQLQTAEKLGAGSPETVGNLALAALGNLDTTQHSKYFARLSDLSPSHAAQQEHWRTPSSVWWTSLPSSHAYRWLLKTSPTDVSTAAQASAESIFRNLFPFTMRLLNQGLVIVMIFVSLALGAAGILRDAASDANSPEIMANRAGWDASASSDLSWIWHIVPCGGMFMHHKTIGGVVLLSAFLSMGFLITGIPLGPLRLNIPVESNNVFVATALVGFLLLVMFVKACSLVSDRRKVQQRIAQSRRL